MHPVSNEIKQLGAELFGSIGQEPPKKRAKLNQKRKEKQSQPAWQDPEDEHIDVDISKNRKLRHLRHNFNENEIKASDYIKRQRKQFSEYVQGFDTHTNTYTHTKLHRLHR